MEYRQFGKIQLIKGQNKGRFPFCNSLLIADGVKTIIDPGAGLAIMTQISDAVAIDLVINTHFHFDHIAYNHLFEGSKIYINDVESDCYRNRRGILQRLGMVDYYGDDWAEGWFGRISRSDSAQSPYSPQTRHEWWLPTARIDGTYRWDDIMDFGTTKMEVIGTPGHSAGFCCFHFRNEGLVYVGDLDLTAFGPWYFGADGDIGQFIVSAEKIANLDAEIFITGHEAGVVSRDGFRTAIKRYIDIIDQRDQLILAAMDEPASLESLHSMGLIYGKKFLVDEWLRAWDMGAIERHLDRLVARGKIIFSNGRYMRVNWHERLQY
ncbi:MAG: MBL fold metallo-hydrolase [Syntrophales bacterium LBB04]|nr:MBL fold metallo-hydrolase [Syntrophales bacterium LBB04]